MHVAIVNAVEQSCKLITPNMSTIPAGTAIQNGRTSAIGDKFCQDGYHLNRDIGRFAVACTWYEFVFGNVMDNLYQPENIPEHHTAIAKRAAYCAVAKPGEVTDMSTWE